MDDYLASAGKIEDAVRKARRCWRMAIFTLDNSTELLAAVQPVAERGAAVEAMPCSLGDDP